MIQKWVKLSAMLLGLAALLSGCGAGSGGGNGSNPPTATLSASPTTIAVGQHSKLTFTSTNANSGTIDSGVGVVGINGSTTVSPTQTTTYTFTASGPGGSANASATVTVSPAPTVTISANPATVAPGQSTTLTVSATNATQVVITDNLDSNTYTLSANGGTKIVSPTATTVYTATASATNEPNATATVTVTVPPPSATLSASPASIFAGQGSTLTWTTTDATSAVIDNGFGAVPLNGSHTVTPTQTTTYTITATGNGQAVATATVTVSPVNSFEGMAEDSTNTGETDIDANGAVGTKQFMEYVNTEYQAYDKATHAAVWSTPKPIGTPWSGNVNCDGTKIRLDAVIIFDRLASRWVIAAKTSVKNAYYFCIAVSNTDDLSSNTLTWYPYFFSLDLTLGMNSQSNVYFPDWPKLGTGPDAYFASMDMIDPDTNVEVGVVACAFDRANMLKNNGVNTPQCFKDTSDTSPLGVYLGHSLIPADVDGTTAPPSGRDEFMVSIQNPPIDGVTTTSATFNLWDFHVDWTTPANSTFTLASQPPVDAYTPGCYDASAPTQTFCVPEPPTTIGQTIDSVGDRFMPRFAYRNFGSRESFLISHTVQTGLGSRATQTGIRWYELEGSGTPTVNQQGTINPDNNYYRFLPSIAQDHAGNAAVGYSVSNPGTDPAIDFSYWNLPSASAPGEVIVINGAGEEVSTGNGQGKWGSYSSMTVDPVDDCTFWYVNEYWPTNAAWSTKIAYFKVAGCQ